MLKPPVAVFSFDEPDHLTRIHLKLGLEDLGFLIKEQVDTLAITTSREAFHAALADKLYPP
jgi:hypothetical protein